MWRRRAAVILFLEKATHNPKESRSDRSYIFNRKLTEAPSQLQWTRKSHKNKSIHNTNSKRDPVLVVHLLVHFRRTEFGPLKSPICGNPLCVWLFSVPSVRSNEHSAVLSHRVLAGSTKHLLLNPEQIWSSLTAQKWTCILELMKTAVIIHKAVRYFQKQKCIVAIKSDLQNTTRMYMCYFIHLAFFSFSLQCCDVNSDKNVVLKMLYVMCIYIC